MGIVDPLLPAAVHLTGPFAGDVLRPAVELAGGTLGAHRCTHVHYRPGHDLVAQFRAEVTWPGGRTHRETLLAATTASGAPNNTVVVTADSAAGELEIGVWRWPFDPALPALETSVRSTADLLSAGGLIDPGDTVEVDVVTYRPTERAVLRARADGSTWYVKVVAPSAAPEIVGRHRLLGSHGLPVPQVLAGRPDEGWMVLAALVGTTLRELIKRDAATWLEPRAFPSLLHQLSSVDGSERPAMRRRLADAPFHAAMLSSVLPSERSRLDRLLGWIELEAARSETRPRGFVHGDLHESQLIVERGRIVGVLDIDEAGMGDPVDDIAVPVAHLLHRSIAAPNGSRIVRLADALVETCLEGLSRAAVDAGTVAVLLGLATGPFRAQSTAWREQVSAVLDLIDRTIPEG